VVFHFDKQTLDDKEFIIPIYLVEDQLSLLHDEEYLKSENIARLIYNMTTKVWRVERLNI
jgi:hypothetical protein